MSKCSMCGEDFEPIISGVSPHFEWLCDSCAEAVDYE